MEAHDVAVSEVRTPADLIDALGGPSKLAAKLSDWKPNAVGNWKWRGFPDSAALYFRLRRLAEDVGVDLTEEKWASWLATTRNGGRES